MQTRHEFINGNANKLCEVGDNSIDLIVTSPPYPMIEMWDDQFKGMSKRTGDYLDDKNGYGAYLSMMGSLEKSWSEMYRVLKPGRFACINIGDAVRTVNGTFLKYPSAVHIAQSLIYAGFEPLPTIIWRKQTNAPNKFMGSGMLPSGAYVTLEHEHILIFRKGGRRQFKAEEKRANRRKSAFFWEERNVWFSDIWDFKGTKQKMNGGDSRKRSGAFPLELPYRLINMYSVYGDTVLDPFSGTGTTTLAALSTRRNSIGVDIEKEFETPFHEQVSNFKETANSVLKSRIKRHRDFVEKRTIQKGAPKHYNKNLGVPVMSKQEADIELYCVNNINFGTATYSKVLR